MNENWGDNYQNLGKIYEKPTIFRVGGREKFPAHILVKSTEFLIDRGELGKIAAKTVSHWVYEDLQESFLDDNELNPEAIALNTTLVTLPTLMPP